MREDLGVYYEIVGIVLRFERMREDEVLRELFVVSDVAVVDSSYFLSVHAFSKVGLGVSFVLCPVFVLPGCPSHMGEDDPAAHVEQAFSLQFVPKTQSRPVSVLAVMSDFFQYDISLLRDKEDPGPMASEGIPVSLFLKYLHNFHGLKERPYRKFCLSCVSYDTAHGNIFRGKC